MDKFNKVSKILSTSIQPNDDLLITRANLIAYVDRSKQDRVEEVGIKTPDYLMKHNPELALNIFGEEIVNHPLYKHCVLVNFCRIPIIEKTKQYLVSNVPVKITTNKLSRAKETFSFYTYKFSDDGPKKISLDQLGELSKKEKFMFNKIIESQHPMFLDIPMIAIKCEGDGLPGFVCKVLKDSNKIGVL